MGKKRGCAEPVPLASLEKLFFPICVSFYTQDVLLVVCCRALSVFPSWRSRGLAFFRSSAVPLFRAVGAADVVNRASAIVITNY